MSFPDRRTTNILLTILLFAAVCGFVYIARHVILVFVLSIFFAYLISPAVRFVQHHPLALKQLRGAAVTKVYVGFLILTALGLYAFGPALARNTMKAVDLVPIVLDRVSTGEIATDIGDKYGWNDQQKERLRTVIERHKDSFQGLQSWIDNAISQGARIIGWMALIPILAIFFLRDGDRMAEAAISTLFPPKQRQAARTIAYQIHAMLNNYIRAQVLLSLFSLAFYMPVLLLLRFPHAVALSVLGAMLEFIPVMGWMSTAAVIVGVGMANDLHWVLMLALLLLWRVTQDYFNLPRALGHKVELHPLLIIFAVLAGAEVDGIVAIYLAVPLVAALRLIWKARYSMAREPLAEAAGSELPPLVELTRD